MDKVREEYFDPLHFIYSDSTEGIDVRVNVQFVPKQSDPRINYYFFAYTVTIENTSNRIVQLVNRHWIIRDGQGHQEIVYGEGVIGQRPVIVPNHQFVYTSFCPIRTQTGSMRGHYEMKDISSSGSGDQILFKVKIIILK